MLEGVNRIGRLFPEVGEFSKFLIRVSRLPINFCSSPESKYSLKAAWFSVPVRPALRFKASNFSLAYFSRALVLPIFTSKLSSLV